MRLSNLLFAVHGARHQVLNFHRVLPDPDPLLPHEPTSAQFDVLISRLVRDFRVVPLQQAIADVREGKLRGYSLSITFDDGYRDNFTHALPVLQRYGAPASFYVATGFLDGGCMWNDAIIETIRTLPPGEYSWGPGVEAGFEVSRETDRVSLYQRVINALKYLTFDERESAVRTLVEAGNGVPADLMMTSQDVAEMAGLPGVEIGGHTRHHPILVRLDDTAAMREIEAGRDDLATICGKPPLSFAYPNGKFGTDYLKCHSDMVRDAGFECALATDWGCMQQSTNLYATPRFTPWGRTYPKFVLGLLRSSWGML